MKLAYPAFDDFIKNNTTIKTRNRYDDSEIISIRLSKDIIDAEVFGTLIYQVRIKFNKKKVTDAQCTCLYNQKGYCKHIVHTLVRADAMMLGSGPHTIETTDKNLKNPTFPIKKKQNTFIFQGVQLTDLKVKDIDAIAQLKNTNHLDYHINKAKCFVNKLDLSVIGDYYSTYAIEIEQKNNNVELSCSCTDSSDHICKHLYFVLQSIIEDVSYHIPFNEKRRHQYLHEATDRMGYGDITDIDDFFDITIQYDRIYVSAKYNILPVTDKEIGNLKDKLLSSFHFPDTSTTKKEVEFIVAEPYTNGIDYTLMAAPLAKSGKMKSPIYASDIHLKIEKTSKREELLFYTALIQQIDDYKPDNADVHIIKNPLQLPVYLFDNSWGNEKITPKKIKPIQIEFANASASLNVKEKGDFYQLIFHVSIKGKKLKSNKVSKFGRYVDLGNTYYYLEDDIIFKMLSFFEGNKHEILLTKAQFPKFKKEFLDTLEQSVKIEYSFVKKAPKKMVKAKSLDEITNHIIYLSESEDYILITPVVQYGDVEAPILSRRNIYTENKAGTMYQIDRNETAELRFKRTLQEQHPDFKENPQTNFYYLHKQKFIEEGWFIEAFEEWRKNNYTILGFKELKSNKNLNPNKMSVNTRVESGIDWFDVHTDIQFGNQKVGLKEIQKSVRNKQRYVKLGDGTKGVLPQEWIDKFGKYFRSGEIKDDFLRTHKSQFNVIDELFDKEVLSEETKIELEEYREKLANFHSIRNVKVPKKLKAQLRDYQKEGLNWLNFLDEFGFGGCLADDMGLGKTIQILSYFLRQLENGNKNPNLVVVPTSLLHNWEVEIKKFAPSLKYKTIYGANRATKNIDFKKFNLLITSYGTMLNDIEILKEVEFNVVVLDESQAIKNPQTKRYKAARLIQARQKIVATGTPVENNTFDLYSQLSFAMPGLFGGARQFATNYSTPIDKFKDESRAKELQEKVQPFILRRTKSEVAKELPEKTEMVIRCEMGKNQRRVYDTYKKEFQKFLKNKDKDELKSSSMHILQGLTKMRQICNTPSLLSDQEDYGRESAKLDELLEQIQKLQGEHKILVFSQFVKMLDLIRERLDKEKIKYAYLTGQTRKRQEQVDLFQEDEETRVFLISLKAGGTGLNLTEAEYVFIVDPWWNPAVENQAIDRAHRIGQKNKVIAIRLITPDTIEEKIMELQDQKKKLVEDLIHTDSGFFKQLSKDDLMKIV